MSQELKPCPFCAKDMYAHDYNAFDSAVVCEYCFAKGPTGIKKDAIAAWNTRADATLTAERDALRLALKNCRNGLELLLQNHEPRRATDPFDTINELRETVRTATALLAQSEPQPPAMKGDVK
jgi:hypothetical protein